MLLDTFPSLKKSVTRGIAKVSSCIERYQTKTKGGRGPAVRGKRETFDWKN